MKTNELIKKLNEMNYTCSFEDDDKIIVIDDMGDYWIEINFYKKDNDIGISTSEDRYISKKYFNVLNIIMEYCNTPLSEREEEKKYHLRFPKGYNSWYSYLAKEINKDNGEYDCSGKCIDNEKYKNIFTQKEIDEMPFDTSFFVKEEVK